MFTTFIRYFQAVSLTVITASVVFTLAGCGSAKQDFQELLHLNMPSPSEAATWMFNRDPEKRRLGISLIANAPFGGEDVYVDVYRKAISDVDSLVRAAAAQALGLHGTGDDAPVLAPLLHDDSELVRLEAARALQRLHNPTVVPALIETMLQDESSDVKAAAATALGQYPERRVVDALISSLDDRSLTVNIQARRSLRILTGQDLGTHREEWLAWYQSTDTPFKNEIDYHYPVYSRKLSWYEVHTPFGASGFEKPGEPRGVSDEPVNEKHPEDSSADSQDSGDGNG